MAKRFRAAVIIAFSVLMLMSLLCISSSAAESITKATVSYKTSCEYTGAAIKPAVKVSVSGKVITTADYTVAYSNNINIGTAAIKITGKGNYTGTVTKSFNITPATVKNVKAAVTTNKITLSWTKGTGVTAYQVFIRDDSTSSWVKKVTTTGNTASVTGLEPGTTYKFLVRAYTKKTTYLYSPYTSVQAKTKVDTVTGGVSAPSTTWSKITWNTVKNADGYQVYVYDNATASWVRKRTVTTNTVNLTGLLSASEYKVRIRAYSNKDGTLVYGAFSSTVLVTTKPDAVKNVTVTAYTSKSATLSWSKVARATGYYIYVGRSDSRNVTPSYKNTKYVTGNTVTLTGLQSCGYYGFRVLPCYKNSLKKNVYGTYGQSEIIFTPIEKVSSFRVTETANNYAVLSWAAQPTVSGYQLYMRTNEETKTTLVATLPSDVTSYKLTGLKELTGYRFYISAYHTDLDGNTVKSGSAGAITTTDDGRVDSVKFTAVRGAIYVGYNFKFETEVSPYYATNKKVTYSSSNKDIAIVYSNGRVVGLKQGTVVITAKTADGGYTAKATVKIVPLKSTAISVPTKIAAYPNEVKTVKPVFTPAKTTDQSFKITGQNHTYTYKKGIFGTTYTATCNFSDYVRVSANGQITGIKKTVEPETGKSFSFKVTFTANDTGVKDTALLCVTDRPLTVSYNGNRYPWYCTDSARLSATVASTADFKADQVLWESSDTSVATVGTDGTVYCKGVGTVKITAYSPDKLHSAEYPIYVMPKVTVSKGFFSSCKVGDEYTLDVSVVPSGTEYSVSVPGTDVIRVDGNKVTVLKQGSATAFVSSGNATAAVVFTTDSWVKPAEDTVSLVTLAKEKLNSVKQDMPRFIRYDQTDYTSFVISDSSAAISSAELEEIFSQFASSGTSRVVEGVRASDYGTTAEYNAACGKYYKNMPVSGNQNAVLSSFDANDITAVEYIDNNGPTYDIRLTVRDEYMASASAANSSTSHGKIFDILSGAYINDVITTLNSGSDSSLGSISASYQSFAQNYHDSTVTVTIDKLTGKVDYVDYDMNISIDITRLKLSMGILSALNSDLSFDVHNNVEIDIID